jgi:hypothetical protein
MRTIKQLTNNKFLNIKEVSDLEKGVRGYQFAERLGKDSIAFICYDRSTKKYLLNHEYTPPTNEFLIRAFGGSLDKKISKNDIVKEEVKEEAGYTVIDSMIYEVGSVFVSTQMNQRCYLYLVDITNAKQTGRSPENEVEKMATELWKEEIDVIKGDDWKSIVIIEKAKENKII